MKENSKGAYSKQLSSYIDMNLENRNSGIVIIHGGTNDLRNGSNEPRIDTLKQLLVR